MRAWSEAHIYGVAHPPVVPVAGAALWHHYGAGFFAINFECAYGASVFGVDGTIAVGITYAYGV